MSIDAKPSDWDSMAGRYYDNRSPRDVRENVDHPIHYRTGDIECIDAIKAALGSEGFIDYCHGNALKYLWRWRHKNGIEDVEKALVYLDWMIKEGRNGEQG